MRSGTEAKKDTEQYNKDSAKSERERKLLAKLEASEAKLNKIKNAENAPEDEFGRQIVALVAIGKYTFEEVYKLTMLQFIHLLRKYVDIEKYELFTLISPYMSGDSTSDNKHWLEQ